AMRALDARGQVTFGGRLSAQARGWLGFLARRMERAGHTGDFRNPQRIRAWARGIATDISTAAGISTAAAPSAGGVRSVAAMPSAGDISSAGDVSSGAGNPSTAGRQSGDPGAGQR